MDLYESIKLSALNSVVNPDTDYLLRKYARYFSEHFHTPLYDVEKLPTVYILEHVFESIYENMDEEERIEFIHDLLESPEEKEKKSKQADANTASDEDFAKMVEDGSIDAPPKESEQTKDDLKELASDLVNLAASMQDLKINFINDDQLEEEIEGASILAPIKVK